MQNRYVMSRVSCPIIQESASCPVEILLNKNRFTMQLADESRTKASVGQNLPHLWQIGVCLAACQISEAMYILQTKWSLLALG